MQVRDLLFSPSYRKPANVRQQAENAMSTLESVRLDCDKLKRVTRD